MDASETPDTERGRHDGGPMHTAGRTMSFEWKQRVSAGVLGLGLLCLHGISAAAELVVEVTGLASDEGSVVVELFGSRVGFPKQASYTQSVQPSGGLARAEFLDLGPSDYAVFVFHDRNGNGRADRGFGSEPFGYSNVRAGERADWDEARISLGIDPLSLRIDLAEAD